MTRAVQVCNALSKIVVKTLFRNDYSHLAMRRHMNIISGYPLSLLKKKSKTTEIESLNIDGVPAELISTFPNQKKIILLVHGGGYFMGSLRSFRRIAWKISHACDAKVLVVDYRLAPEHQYPAALVDVKKAYRFLREKYPESEIVIGGDSAGGGLTLAVTLSLRDEGAKLPDKVFAVSPWTDLIVEGESVAQNKNKDFWLNENALKLWGKHYYGETDPKDPYVSPVFADYTGFPPLLIFSGDQEILHSDSKRVFELAKKAGVKAELHVGRDMQHDWFLAFPFLEASKNAMSDLKKFVGVKNG